MRDWRQIARAAALAAVVGVPGIAQDVTLTVTGDDTDLTKAVTGASLVVTAKDNGETNAQDLLSAARADYRRLLVALYGQGHYGGKVSILVDGRELAQIAPLDQPSTVSRIAITVEPGPAFRFGQVSIAPLPTGTAPAAEVARGQPAKAGALRKATSRAVESWRSAGHAKAAIASDDITADHAQNSIDADIRLAPGPKLSFGPLLVAGQSAVRPARVRQIAGLPEGETFDPEVLDQVTTRLRRTGTFASVSLKEADAPTPDLRLPITAQLEDLKPRRIGAGLEYSTTEGISASAYWLHRNFLGGAERFRVEANVSGIGVDGNEPDYETKLEFSRPGTIGPENTLFVDARAWLFDEPEYWIRAAEATVGMRRIVDEDFTVSAGLGIVSAKIRDDLGARGYTLLTLPLESALDKRDDANDAHRGFYISAELTPFYETESSTPGLRAKGDLRGYLSFGTDDRFTLAGRVQMGSLIGPDATQAPADYLFYSGGGGTVRGQSYQSLGVDLGDGVTIGGRSFLGGSVEARAKVRKNWGLVGFYDIGLIGKDPTPGANARHHAGAGLGVRYDTRLGPIRLDVATPTTGDKAGRDVQFYIGIGQAF